MTGKTHLSSGIAASLLICPDITTGVLLSVGSLLPDVDSKNSLLGKALPFISKIVTHRTWTHSLVFLLISYFINIYLFYGYCLHIILDMMTKQGCPLLYPIDFKFKFPFASFIRTDGIFENLLFIMILIINIYLIIRFII